MCDGWSLKISIFTTVRKLPQIIFPSGATNERSDMQVEICDAGAGANSDMQEEICDAGAGVNFVSSQDRGTYISITNIPSISDAEDGILENVNQEVHATGNESEASAGSAEQRKGKGRSTKLYMSYPAQLICKMMMVQYLKNTRLLLNW